MLGAGSAADALTVPSRHLGLIPAAEPAAEAAARVDALGAAVAAQVDLDAVVRSPAPPGPLRGIKVRPSDTRPTARRPAAR